MKYYSFVVKKKRRFNLGIAFLCLALVIILVLCFSLTKNDKVRFEKKYYIVYIYGFSKRYVAEECSDMVQGKGASGMVVFDNDFKVLCFLYTSLSVAEKVKESLISNGYDAKVDAWNTPKIKRKAMSLLSDLQGEYSWFADAFSCFYKLAWNFDLNKVAEVDVFQNVVKFRNSMHLLLAKIDNNSVAGNLIKVALQNCFVVVVEFLENNFLTTNVSSGLKTICFHILFEFSNFAENVNSLI